MSGERTRKRNKRKDNDVVSVEPRMWVYTHDNVRYVRVSCRFIPIRPRNLEVVWLRITASALQVIVANTKSLRHLPYRIQQRGLISRNLERTADYDTLRPGSVGVRFSPEERDNDMRPFLIDVLWHCPFCKKVCTPIAIPTAQTQVTLSIHNSQTKTAASSNCSTVLKDSDS